MRALVVASFVAAAGARADAHPCDDAKSVEGSRGHACAQRGAGYVPPMVQYNLGFVSTQLAISDAAAADAGLDPGIVRGYGGQFRGLAGVHGIHVGVEMTILRFDTHALATRSTAGTSLMHGVTVPDMRWVAGVRRAHRALFTGIELAAGGRFLYRDGGLEEETGLQGVVDARAQLGLYVTPYMSLTTQAGVSLVRADEYTFTVMFGAGPIPWDGLR